MSFICPESYVPTDIEHKAAYRLWLLQRIVDDYLLGINMARKGHFGEGLDPEYAERELALLLSKLFDKEPSSDDEFWETMHSFDEFKKNHIRYLSEAHMGDCVCLPCSCSRCHAEQLYAVPLTATWSKHEGSALYREWLKSPSFI